MTTDAPSRERTRRLRHAILHGKSTEELAAARQERDRAAAEAREAKAARRQRYVANLALIEEILPLYGNLLGRPLAIDRQGRDRRLAVVQRCAACCKTILTYLDYAIECEDGWQAQLGAAVRHDYDAHRCAAPALDMAGWTPDQMFEALAEAERMTLRCGERVRAIEDAIRALPEVRP